MKKINTDFWRELQKLEIAPPENIKKIKDYIRQGKITFFSWKMFDITIQKSKPYFSNNFDIEIAEKYVQPEKQFLNLLTRYNIKFQYIKIIPDELPLYFWGTKNKKANVFCQQVERYFQQLYPQTEIVFFSSFLVKKNFKYLYDKIFRTVLFDFKVPLTKLNQEIATRSAMYKANPNEVTEISKKAFALFAAESVILAKVSKSTYQNMVLLGGKRSTDTYKYDFYKYPKNRPTLPKLFVI